MSARSTMPPTGDDDHCRALRFRWAVAVLILIAAGCDRPAPVAEDPPIPMAPAQKPADSDAADAPSGMPLTEPVERKFAGITLQIPAGWEERPVASEFIQAEYRITGPAGETARVTLSSAGGGVEANLDRWKGQFQRGASDPAPEQTTLVVDGHDAAMIELHGTFTDGFSGRGPQPGSCMLGAVIPTGPANFFLKMTGPREIVLSQREKFQDLVRSAQLD